MSITIDGTTGISGNNGSASTPAIQGEDTNTGVFFPAADTVAIATNGTERMRVAPGTFGGYLGIGTTAPSAPLNVSLFGTSNVPVSSFALARIEQGPTGSSETTLQIAARDQSGGGAAIHFGVGALANSTRIVSLGATDGLVIQENSGGPIRFSTSGGEAVRVTSTGNLQFNSGYGSVATAFGCRAWVNFNGTGTVAIRASGNVSSITDNGTGNYTVNFATPMPDVNYSFIGMGGAVNGQGGSWGAYVTELHNASSFIRTTTSVQFITASLTATLQDAFTCNIAIFR